MRPIVSYCLLLLVLVPGCARNDKMSATETLSYTDSFSASWRINVDGTRNGSIDSCVADPFVAELRESSILSASEFTVVLIPDTTKTQARKVATCLEVTFPENLVTIVPPA